MTYNVSATDVESRWRPLSDAESDVTTVLLDDATALLDTYRPRVAPAVAAGTVPERIVVMMLADAVIRVLSNPDRLSQQSITADGGISMGWQFEAKTPTPRLRLTDFDFAGIDQAMANAGLGAGRTSSMRMRASTRWGLLVTNDDDEDSEATPGLLVFPGRSDTVTMSDNFSLVVQ